MSSPTELINLLEDTASLLQKTQANLKKCPKSRLTKGYVEARIRLIEDYWLTFKRAHQDLVRITPKEKKSLIPYFVNEDFFIYEDLYLVVLADLRDILNPVTPGAAASSQNNSSSNNSNFNSDQFFRLPRIELPKFSGNYEEWPTFMDMFLALVHENTSISDVQKLHYLKNSVTGEAESLLKRIQVTNRNYEQAWNTLKSRYGNKRLIINSVLKRLFNQKRLSSQSCSQIKSLLDVTSDCINNLNNLNISTDSWDPIIIFLVTQKLDPESHKDWEQSAYNENSEELPTWEALKKFLQAKYRMLELVTSSSSSSSALRDKVIKERSFHVATASSPSTSSERACILCKENHTLCHCKEFTKMQPIERSEYVKKVNLCFNCLVPGHSAHQCKLPMSCRICKKRHHTLLHQNHSASFSEPSGSEQPQTMHHSIEEEEEVHVNTTMASYNITERSTCTALLATATVIARGEQNRTVVLRALVDQGSQASFISEKATQMLNLKKQSARGSIIGVGSTRTNINHVVQFEISSCCDMNFSMKVQAYVMNKELTAKIPSKAITVNNWPHLEGLHLADTNYHTPGPIDLLLGVKEYAQILQQQLVKGPPGTPCAQKTNLGWILFGEIDTNAHDESFLVLHHQVDIDDMLKSLWELDEDFKRKRTKEENLCESIYEETYTRTIDGRYVVRLPFKTRQPISPEGNTKEIAKNRLLHLEKKLKRNPQLKEEYSKVMQEYLTLGHMEEIPENERIKNAVYLPHHAVIRCDKDTSKTRVVFDASAKGTNNVSLNDELLVGPQLQEDLRNLILRWRLKRVCYASDIQQMYRQVLVDKEDADNYQRVLWRDDESERVKEFRLLRVTFGVASAPYLAVKTLHQVAEDEGQNYSAAVQTIKRDFYMDDLLSGDDTTERAIITAQEVTHILKRGGFMLSKWSSNCSEFMKSIDSRERATHAQLDIKLDGTVKALGLIWNLGTDHFNYQLNLPSSSSSITKRVILSSVQKLFDPLGWIAPTMIIPKILIQKLWLEKIGWDDKISPLLSEEWLKIKADLENVHHIHIDRWLGTVSTEMKNVQIHGFSDASMEAYAAVAYIRTETPDGYIATKLIAAKTRVAPLRTVSLPRLELLGAVILSRLMHQIGEAMQIPIEQMFAWTDSSIVIAWLSGEPHRWKPYVANRVVEITENINTNRWHHVSSNDNPADIASRGMLLDELKDSELWWRGPAWLSEREIEFKETKMSTELERKVVKIQANLKVQDEGRSLTSKMEEFENLKELLVVIIYCRRFLNFKRKSDNIHNNFTTEELEGALMSCIRLVQEEEYKDEIDRLKSERDVNRNSNIKTLCPYLDENKILRVGGRLRHANLDEQTKHPIILGHKNNLVSLIIADAHTRTLHGGLQLMLCYLRTKYWIIRVKGLIKLCVHNCLVCARHRATSRNQIMGDLPKERVTPARAFLHSGVDFAGPFQILTTRGRGAKVRKAYISLFICMSTKAIHLELVGDLSKDAFIAAFKRFVSRRGQCTNIWSDQGRNFIGADRELRLAFKEANLVFESTIPNALALEGTQWHYIPAYAPNFGGLWEAGVKSVKYHLKRVLKTNITFEEMTTVLCQIEACLNSRPLCPISDDEVIETLTPGHFLIGEAPVVVPSPDFKDIKVHNLTRWQYTQKLLGDFWRRWQQEYLSRLQQRPIWLKRVKEFNVGDIVLIKTDGLPPGKWSMGRIVDKHPGEDNITRVYSVKSGNNIIKRAISKLCPLPIVTE